MEAPNILSLTLPTAPLEPTCPPSMDLLAKNDMHKSRPLHPISTLWICSKQWQNQHTE